MPKIHFKQNILNDAYRAVHDHLALHYAPGTIAPEHIKTITLEAFELLQSSDLSIKKLKGRNGLLNSDQRAKLIGIVKEIVVSPHTPWKPELRQTAETVKQLFLDALRGTSPSLSRLRQQMPLLKAVAWKKNPEILKEGRALIQELLEDVCKELDGLEAQRPRSKDFHFEMIIGDLLALYPFLGSGDADKLTVPVILNGKWRRVEYDVQKIELTPRWMGSPLVALGLSAPSAPPLLLFKGTTYPTDTGFGLSLLTDLNPAASVGAYAFRLGRNRIGKWLDSHASARNPAVVYGKSLGGALCWRAGLHFKNRIGKVMAYGPPGFSAGEARQLQRRLRQPGHPAIHVFCQKGDPVPYFDKLSTCGVHYYLVVGSKATTGFRAHAETFSTHPHSAIIRLNVSKESASIRRHVLTTLKRILSFLLFPMILMAYSSAFALRKASRLLHRVAQLKL